MPGAIHSFSFDTLSDFHTHLNLAGSHSRYTLLDWISFQPFLLLPLHSHSGLSASPRTRKIFPSHHIIIGQLGLWTLLYYRRTFAAPPTEQTHPFTILLSFTLLTNLWTLSLTYLSTRTADSFMRQTVVPSTLPFYLLLIRYSTLTYIILLFRTDFFAFAHPLFIALASSNCISREGLVKEQSSKQNKMNNVHLILLSLYLNSELMLKTQTWCRTYLDLPFALQNKEAHTITAYPFGVALSVISLAF